LSRRFDSHRLTNGLLTVPCTPTHAFCSTHDQPLRSAVRQLRALRGSVSHPVPPRWVHQVGVQYKLHRSMSKSPALSEWQRPSSGTVRTVPKCSPMSVEAANMDIADDSSTENRYQPKPLISCSRAPGSAAGTSHYHGTPTTISEIDHTANHARMAEHMIHFVHGTISRFLSSHLNTPPSPTLYR
jgi:hypothetical protein